MKIEKKYYWIGGIALVLLSIAGYFTVKYFKLKKAYQTILTQDEVLKMVLDKSKDLSPEMEVDDAILKAQQDVQLGTNITDAVLINGIIYTFNPDTFWFEDNKENYYDPETDSVTIGETTTYVNPSSVTFGTVDSEGKFTF